MVPYFGDFDEDATVLIPFNTFSSDDPAASVTITDLADADIKVHKNGSTTEVVTDGATVVIDFDSVTGNHLVAIDTSAHADYSTGADYLVRMEGTTVDGATVNAWIGQFSIENRYMRGTDSAYTGTPPTAGAIADAVLDEATSGHTSAGTVGKLLIDALADTNELQGDWTNGGRLDLLLDAIKAVTDALPDSGALTSLATAANLATVAGYIDTEVAAIKAVTDNLPDSGALTSLAAAAELAKVPKSDGTTSWNATALAAINAQLLDVLSTDTFAEPSGVPAATTTLATKIGYLYMALRNQVDVTATKKTFYDDGGSGEWSKTLSDNGTTYSEAEGSTP